MVCENVDGMLASQSCSSGAAPLSSFGFDHLGRMAWRQYPAGASADKVAYSWSPRDELLIVAIAFRSWLRIIE